MLLDDWRPGDRDEWFDVSGQHWLYRDSAVDPASRNGASGHELVLQTLSDASGAARHA